MKLKKILAGAMAGAMVLGSLTITSAETTTDLLIDGLTAYYSFDDTLENAVTGASATLHGGASTDANDFWNTDATGSAAYTEGVVGNAYSFTGDSTTLDDNSQTSARGEGLELDVLSTDSFTISGWVYTEQKIDFQPIFFGAYSTDDYFNCGTIFNGYWGGVLTMLGGWNGDVRWVDNGSYDIQLTTWTYLTVTVASDGTVSFYFNGELADSETFTSYNNEFSGIELFLGVNYWNDSFKGAMDEVTVYNTALTADQIATLYANNGCPYVYGIYADSDTIYMTVDQTDSAADYITLVPTSLSASDVTYAVTEGSDYVSVTTDGTITALAKGDAVITATYGGSTSVTNKTATLKVSVTDPNSVTGITTSISEATLTVGNTLTISGTAVAEKSGSPITDKYTVTYTSSDTSIATVNESTGVVTAVAAGTATITITVTGTDTDGKAYTYSTTVALTVEAAAVTTTEETTTEDTETTESSEEAESSEEDSEEVSYTTVVKTVELDDLEAEDWWTVFTDGLELVEGQQVVITGTTTNNSTNNWNNALFILYSSDDGAVYAADTDEATAANYIEYFVGRMDNYGWGTATYEITSEPDDWDAWLAATQAGAEFTITVTYLDDTIQIVSSCEGAEYVVTYEVADDSLTYYVALTGEACTLTDLVATYYEADEESLVETTEDTEDTEDAEDGTTTVTSEVVSGGGSSSGADTGDASPIIPIAVAMLGCAAVVVAGKKRMA